MPAIVYIPLTIQMTILNAAWYSHYSDTNAILFKFHSLQSHQWQMPINLMSCPMSDILQIISMIFYSKYILSLNPVIQCL